MTLNHFEAILYLQIRGRQTDSSITFGLRGSIIRKYAHISFKLFITVQHSPLLTFSLLTCNKLICCWACSIYLYLYLLWIHIALLPWLQLFFLGSGKSKAVIQFKKHYNTFNTEFTTHCLPILHCHISTTQTPSV